MMYELQHYNDCILSGFIESSVTTHANSLRYIELTEKIYESFSPYLHETSH